MRMSGNGNFPAIRPYPATVITVSNNKFYRDCRNHDAVDQGLYSLDWRKYQPKWRRRMTWHAPAATRVAIAIKYYNQT